MMLLAALIVTLASLIGVALTMLVMPGIWVMIAVAIACWAWQPHMYSWPTIAVAVVLAIAAEIIELVASAAGARKTGGSRAAAVASVIGSIAGAIAGTIFLAFLPIIGTLIGAVAGAGIAAALIERGVAGQSYANSFKTGRGAATGRLVATLIKSAFAVIIAVLLSVAAFV